MTTMLATFRGRKNWPLWLAAVLTCGALAVSAQAQEKGGAARCTAVEGALLMSAGEGKWTRLSVAANKAVPADRLLIALFGAEFISANGAVQAKLVADVGQRGPFPVLEAAVQFHAPVKVDLELSLERGILILTNTNKTGAAHVRLRKGDEAIEVTLAEPKAKLAIEVYGRHVPGPAEVSDPKKDEPVKNVAFFALAGDVVLTTSKHAVRLQAPPGPSLLLWDSVTRMPEVIRFETLPDSVKPMNAQERKLFETINGFAKKWSAKPTDIGATLELSTRSADALERKAAVVALGALDDLPGLLQVLGNKDHGDTRDKAVVVIRHWLGRAPGQSVRLYEHLTKAEKLTPTQAKNLLHLFNGFEAEKLRQPETYQLLIEGLNHKKIVVREMAHWHLVRLAPAGQKIAYDAASAEPQRLEAVEAWRRLIPEGELPPAPKKNGSK